MAKAFRAHAAPLSIHDLSAKLQQLPAQYHWALADEALLRAIARGQPVIRGVRGRKLRDLISVGQKLGLSWLLVWLVAIVELARLIIRQRQSPQHEVRQSDDYPARFFVGFGAGSEESLFRRFCDEHPGKVGRLDQIDVRTFGKWHRVGLMQGFKTLAQALGIARTALAALPAGTEQWHADFMTFVAIRAGNFAYMQAWFDILKSRADRSLEEVTFLAADTTAYAAVAAGVPVAYLQHGLIPYSIQPKFSRVEVLSVDEAMFFRLALPEADISKRLREDLALSPQRMTREVLVASIYGDVNYMSRIAPVVSWARDLGIPVRVRPHPRETSQFWADYEANGMVVIENSDSDFEKAIARLRPRLVISWFSTALAEALDHGVVPVTVCDDGDRNVEDMVYPVFRRCMRWPQDCESIERLLSDDVFYENVLARLRGDVGEVSV